MARLKYMDLPEPVVSEPVPGGEEGVPRQAKNRWGVWLLVLGVVAVGFWYYHAGHSKTEAENSGTNASGGPGGHGQFGGQG
ncbi:MAG TPA: hypothetical protein VHT31_00905, partial [Candidatus Acidoferrum sp.]|nr:hypothetical protein [Candidatus Acidoferrum sp.]